MCNFPSLVNSPIFPPLIKKFTTSPSLTGIVFINPEISENRYILFEPATTVIFFNNNRVNWFKMQPTRKKSNHTKSNFESEMQKRNFHKLYHELIHHLLP